MEDFPCEVIRYLTCLHRLSIDYLPPINRSNFSIIAHIGMHFVEECTLALIFVCEQTMGSLHLQTGRYNPIIRSVGIHRVSLGCWRYCLPGNFTKAAGSDHYVVDWNNQQEGRR